MLAVSEIFSTIHRPVVRDLNNPGCRSSFARVIRRSFLKNKDEDVLAEILGFKGIFQYSLGMLEIARRCRWNRRPRASLEPLRISKSRLSLEEAPRIEGSVSSFGNVKEVSSPVKVSGNGTASELMVPHLNSDV